MKISRIPYELKKEVFFRNSVLRKIQTKNYSTQKLAIGESNDYHFPKDWITVDYIHADNNIDLNSEYKLPFEDNSMDLVYSAHCIEHLTEAKANYVLKEINRVLKKGGKFRVEVPDVTKVIDSYKNRTQEYMDHFGKSFTYMCETFGYDDKYKQDHVGMIATISNYFDDGVAFQIPVYASQEECDSNLKTKTIDEFCDWCIGLQTERQFKTPGHKSYYHFDKMKGMLETAGFSNISHQDFNKSNSDVFKLNQESSGSIKEKPHRRFFSLYVEAEKH